jgi:ketosteroid isomerase-like protein
MSHVETVQKIYAAFGQGHIPGILELLSDDIEWEYLVLRDYGIPYYAPGRGRAAVLNFFERLAESIELTRFEPVNLLAGGEQVVALIHVSVTNKRTGKRFDDFEAHFWGFDQSGRVSQFRHLMDTHAHHLANQP